MREFIIKQDKIDLQKNKIEHQETLFSQANGLIGMRGSVDRNIDESPGTFINGFCETHKIKYGEKAYGFPEIGETIVKLPNVFDYEIIVDEEVVNLKDKKKVENFERTFNLQKGLVKLTFDYTLKKNKQIHVTIDKVVSFYNKNMMVGKFVIQPINFTGEIKLINRLDFNIFNKESKDDPRVGSQNTSAYIDIQNVFSKEAFDVIEIATKESKQYVDLMIAYDPYAGEIQKEQFVNKCTCQTITSTVKAGRVFEVEKYIGLYPLRGLERTVKISDFHEKAAQNFSNAIENNYSFYLDQQVSFLDEFWEKSLIEIKSEEELSQGLHYNLFQLLQSAGTDGISNVAAKGLSGEGYEGHYFWDTEIYVFPFFLMTNPEIAKELLKYRYNILPEARKRARKLNVKKGVKFPWRTITGRESSGYFPAGTAQYHINADIAYAVKMYYEWTGDFEFIKKYGAEILIETARFWCEVGHFNPMRNNQFTIEGVTGPDEYTAIVDNNYYTNKMAQRNLEDAYGIYYKLPSDTKRALEKKLNLKQEEILRWEKAARHMYLPYDKTLNINPQDDSFLSKKVWPFDEVEKEKYPLLLHFHPLVIYRHQVLKQADVILANVLVGTDIDLEVKKNNYEYYKPLTTHDSSLSPCIYSILAAELELPDEAYELYEDTVRMDLDNLHNNSMYGVHTAAMGGSYLGIVYGFAGVRMIDGQLCFKPTVPSKMDGYMFSIHYKGARLKIKVDQDRVVYQLMKGNSIKFKHKNKEISLEKVGDTLEL